MRHRKTFLAASLVLALTVPAALAGDHGKTEAKQDLTSIKGEVQRVYTKTIDGNETVMLDLATADHPRYTVCLGEITAEVRGEMNLADGDEVTVKGHKLVRGNGETIFIAHVLHRGDQRWTLDHRDGMHSMM